jgi:hypothetical protein
MELFSSNQKPYLLDPNILVDSPIPILKSFSQLAKENLWVILLLCLVALVSFLYYFIRKKDSAPQTTEENLSTIDPYLEALEQLKILDSQKPRPETKPFIFRLSEILRLYVERQFNIPAMECTGEEFIQEISEHPLLRERFEEALNQFVHKGDRIKYSTDQFDLKDLDQLLVSARDFIKQAHDEWQKMQQNQLSEFNSSSVSSSK